jgi:hypothetical protein
MLRMLGAILSAVLGVFAGAIMGFFGAVERSMQALGYWPSVPPPDDAGEIDEIAEEESAVQAAEDLNVVRRWASAQLFGRSFDLPAGRIGGWLSVLTVVDAARVAEANGDGDGTLAEHLAGKALVPGLPPVGDRDQTLRWCRMHRPASVLPRSGKRVGRVLSTEPDGWQDDQDDCFSRAA